VVVVVVHGYSASHSIIRKPHIIHCTTCTGLDDIADDSEAGLDVSHLIQTSLRQNTE
jgi:hypothetical protein